MRRIVPTNISIMVKVQLLLLSLDSNHIQFISVVRGPFMSMELKEDDHANMFKLTKKVKNYNDIVCACV